MLGGRVNQKTPICELESTQKFSQTIKWRSNCSLQTILIFAPNMNNLVAFISHPVDDLLCRTERQISSPRNRIRLVYIASASLNNKEWLVLRQCRFYFFTFFFRKEKLRHTAIIFYAADITPNFDQVFSFVYKIFSVIRILQEKDILTGF